MKTTSEDLKGFMNLVENKFCCSFHIYPDNTFWAEVTPVTLEHNNTNRADEDELLEDIYSYFNTLLGDDDKYFTPC